VPNHQLVKEKDPIALAYQNKSVAEQNSIDVAWALLMEPDYDEFRQVLFGCPDDERRFRQLVVNTVIATDIMDADLKCLRNMRWSKAFQTLPMGKDLPATREQTNRKATIVLEHLIQASDVSHTMQHWHIYRKWNERLFQEMYDAYQQGRAEKNPADHWYQGEIGFFDFYIIPLAKKLKDCGVFGVSSDEYLSYALKNRNEWELRGRDIVADLVEKHQTPAAEEITHASPKKEKALVASSPPRAPVAQSPLATNGSVGVMTIRGAQIAMPEECSADPDELFQRMLDAAE
jgi:3'5'-cyclic nucleotide phosphodiesterase